MSPPTSRDSERLAQRLRRLGLPAVSAVELHQNRTVMVSLTGRRVLRAHRGYLYAPDAVLRAIVRFVDPRTRREDRRRAEREVLAFPVSDYVPGRARQARVEPARPGDLRLLRELTLLHRRLCRQYFEGRLPALRIRLSGRMRTRLGELTLDDATRRPMEIALSRRHVERDLWSEVRHTLLHEMVHQWQAQSGLSVDHGPGFRTKAREVGIEPTAHRAVRSRRRAARYS